MATERDIARLLNEEIGPRDSDYVASVLGDYFCDETSETDYEAVEDMEEEVEEGKEEEKETKDCDEDINPPLFDPEVAVELQVSDLDLESAMPDAPATSTTHSGDDMRKEDLQEEEELSKFFEHGCGCSDNCYALFSHSYIKTYRCDIQAMAKPVHKIAIMSQMAATSTMGGLSTGNHRRQNERKRQFFTFMHQGHKICRVTFLKLHACGKSRFEEIMKNYRMNGLIPRVHGNAGKTPNHALTYDDILRVVAFIRNYAEVHGISLPGRIPGMKSYENKKFLPCSTSKRQVYLEYAESCEGLYVKACAETTFNMLWRRYLPYIEKMKPMSDLCATCKEISGLIIRSANMQSDERITEAMQKALDHRRLVKKEREYYKDVLKEAQLLLKGLYTDAANNYNPPLTRPHAMLNIVAHYSFDYAQQVHYPSSPLQAGPIYFLTPRKCGIFGVCCEAIPQQVNFSIDESFDTGKGANPVISMSVSISMLTTAQGKIKIIQLFNTSYGVMTGLNASISISFLPVGHTKFSPDWCFGLLKQKFRKAEVDSLDDFIQVVEQSSAVNKAQPVGSSNGELIVETLDWCSYFATLFKKIKGIKGFQHFVVNATSPGVVAARQAVDGPVSQFNLLKEDAQIMEDELPIILPPKGMSTERKWYLYEKI
uniref:DUF7869 domain-containing protein n=1 Tax=Amphimedon queenslandica TaxID=400682 RepID=A0A1X7T0K5_AMPQE